jgi:chromatin remodeling complex protein RSC6
MPVKEKSPKGKTTKAKVKKPSAFNKEVQVSPALAAVVGNKPMPRTEITKNLWAYIKKHGLQDQSNKRMINSDDTLREVFGGKRKVDMFEMTRLVSKHVKSK